MLGLLSALALLAGAAQGDQDLSPARIGPGPATVVSADTLAIDGVRVRLWGISLPDGTTRCDDYGSGTDCLAGAVWELEHVIQDHDVECEVMRTEADGRLVGRCEALYLACYGVRCDPYRRDLSEELISAGVVHHQRDESDGRYDEIEQTARGGRSGFWAHAVPPSPGPLR